MTTPASLDRLLASMFQAHPWHGVAPRPTDAALATCYIEIVPTDAVKYEIDKPTGHLRIDRPQRFSNVCPTLYGFIPQTWCGPRVGARCAERTGVAAMRGDGDPLDVCVLSEKPFSHGDFLCSARPLGGLRMVDKDEADDKIIAVLEADATYGAHRELGDLPVALIERLEHYFLTYKRGPDGGSGPVRIAERYDAAEAQRVIDASIEDYRDEYGDPAERAARLRALLARG
jgi:inorganic pyrophosphatase